MPCFITAEGIDGTGKSSTMSKVIMALQGGGQKVVLTREPTEGWVGQVIQKGILIGVSARTEALLFTADRFIHNEEIKKWLKEGVHVISDRYHDSTVAYQAARIEEEEGLESGLEAFEWLIGLGRPIITQPDLTLLFLAPPDVCLKRIDGRSTRSTFERETFLNRVEHFYNLLVEKEPGRFIKIDANRDIATVLADAERVVKRFIED